MLPARNIPYSFLAARNTIPYSLLLAARNTLYPPYSFTPVRCTACSHNLLAARNTPCSYLSLQAPRIFLCFPNLLSLHGILLIRLTFLARCTVNNLLTAGCTEYPAQFPTLSFTLPVLSANTRSIPSSCDLSRRACAWYSIPRPLPARHSSRPVRTHSLIGRVPERSRQRQRASEPCPSRPLP